MLSCSELGLGHVTRIMLLGKELERRGHELFLYSGGRAYELLRREFKSVFYCTPVSWYENAYGIITSASILNILFPMPHIDYEKEKFAIKKPSGIETIHRYYDLRRKILEIKPDLIVSDGDLHALRLASRWKIPSIYVTNLIRPSIGLLPLLIPGERFTERYVRNCYKIVVPDNPMPYTICEYNLGNLEHVGIEGKVEFVGSFFDITPVEGEDKYIFAAISGPVGTRARLMKTVIPTLSEMEVQSIVSLGETGKRVTVKVGNCTIYSWLKPEERHEFMANSKVVIFSGGHNTCFEVIKYMKPSICIPTQPEQMANARKLQELNCAIIATNKEQLVHAIREMENKGDFYKENMRMLNRHSKRFRGLDGALKIIESISG
ncbi:MAG: glycosyltransferase [Candidatus Bathyarchaeia archaeon]